MATTRRTPARSGSSSSGGTSSAVRAGYSGAAGLERAKRELRESEERREARKAAGHQPFRFFCSVGETREIIIVDDAPQFFRFEHALKDKRSNRYDNFVPCLAEHVDCPACGVDSREPYFAMYLTIIDNTPYTNSRDEDVPWSKKLLVVKPMQQKKLVRLYEQHGTLRGMILEMTRDGDKDAAIGNDISFIDFMTEEELDEYETVYVDREQKEHDVIGHEPYDYEDVFPDLTEQQVAAMAGGRSGTAMGSRERTRRELDDDRDDDRDSGSRRSASRRGPPSRESTATRRPARGRSRDEDLDEGGDGDGHEEADEPQRTSRRAAPASRRTAEAPAPSASRRPTRGRQPEPEAEDDVEEEAPPPRRADSMASRRAMVRGNR